MTSYKHLFQRAIAAAPDRLHMAAHSHHLWPDASWLGQQAAWEDAARLADRKWRRVMEEIWPAAQAHVAHELGLPDPSTVGFSSNTHDFLLRIASAIERRPIRILTTDGEFHSFTRQALRWVEAGEAVVERVPVADGFEARLLERAASGEHDLIVVSQVMFGTGRIVGGFDALAHVARPEGPWLLIDGYHGFMAVDTDLSAIADRVFYTSGGYKYAMAGEGVGFLHAPAGFAPRPVTTGWYGAFDDLALPPEQVGYAPDARRFLGATFDPSGLYRFVAVRDMLAREGISTGVISAHVAALRDRLIDGLGRSPLGNAELVNPPGNGPQARFIALRNPRAGDWQAALLARDVITDVRGDVLRIGLGLYHDERDIDRFCAIASEL
ncbi:aminotransferase class V-fold PLP-dependent enzyme [Sphingomonas qomolangmaensis]|uniref:Aminotransferase class V-fold PLP-dependent enzyme n=1 Tax=Sphingomonas qomolangmaensis TaxID=2918765 RepID=A0ABY5LDK5_9SPHN|nr:aminotransferase class V-fold PLP-dependent enzyme [Sphingomonas qomolangmaensis]UUL83925.1 aminotransferase class V-fold PLP-dependent enzyme [Sphingomonas qomolangmaensis]